MVSFLVIKKIVSLIYAPNLDDPLEPDIAEIYNKNPKLFESNAQDFVAKFAQWSREIVYNHFNRPSMFKKNK